MHAAFVAPIPDRKRAIDRNLGILGMAVQTWMERMRHVRPGVPGLGAILLMSATAMLAGCQGESSTSSTDPPKSSVFQDLMADSDQGDEPEASFDAGFRFTTMLETGITFEHQSGNSDLRPFPAANGSGVGICDYDLDGFPDIYFANGTTFPIDLSTSRYTDQCYRNLSEFRFQDVSKVTGLNWQGYSAGVAVGDYDSDGFPDVYVNCYGGNRLYHNQGDGTFREVVSAAGVDDPGWGSSATFFDYNSDGLLDLYVGNYAIWNLDINKMCHTGNREERIFCSPLSVEPEKDRLFENRGDGTFIDASQSAGIQDRVSRTQGVLAAELDGKPGTDLYLGNDMHANALFLNNGNRPYRDLTDQSGVGYDAMGRSQAGMGLAAADIDQNGTLELFVTNYAQENNALYELVRENGYSETSSSRGLSADSMQWVGWGTTFLDIDMDQWPDLIVTNGHTDHNKPNEAYLQPCMAWQNQNGRFELTGAATGSYFTKPHLGRGLARADFDNDGDFDLVFAHLNHPPAVLRNDTPRKLAGLSLQLEGQQSNRDAIATQIQVAQGDQKLHYQLLGGGSYLSTHQNLMILPVDPDVDLELTITWPSGQVTTQALSAESIASGKLLRIREPAPVR